MKVDFPQVKVAQKKEKDTQHEEEKNLSVNDPSIYQIMERRDEEQIIASLQGNYLDTFVYSMQNKAGKTIEALSWVGIQEAARAYGGIQCSIDKMKVEETKEQFTVDIEAFDSRTNSSAIGSSSQKKNMITMKGIIKDEFARQKAVSKAQRNAKKQLLPQKLLLEWINKYRDEKKGTGEKDSNKVLVDQLNKAWREKGLKKQYIKEALLQKYNVKNPQELPKERFMEFIAWIENHTVVEPSKKTESAITEGGK